MGPLAQTGDGMQMWPVWLIGSLALIAAPSQANEVENCLYATDVLQNPLVCAKATAAVINVGNCGAEPGEPVKCDYDMMERIWGRGSEGGFGNGGGHHFVFTIEWALGLADMASDHAVHRNAANGAICETVEATSQSNTAKTVSATATETCDL